MDAVMWYGNLDGDTFRLSGCVGTFSKYLQEIAVNDTHFPPILNRQGISLKESNKYSDNILKVIRLQCIAKLDGIVWWAWLI